MCFGSRYSSFYSPFRLWVLFWLPKQTSIQTRCVQHVKGFVVLCHTCGAIEGSTLRGKTIAESFYSRPPHPVERPMPRYATGLKCLSFKDLHAKRCQRSSTLFILARSIVSCRNFGLYVSVFGVLSSAVCHRSKHCSFSRRARRTRQKHTALAVAKQNGERQQPPTQCTLQPCLFQLFVCLHAMQAEETRKKGSFPSRLPSSSTGTERVENEWLWRSEGSEQQHNSRTARPHPFCLPVKGWTIALF